MTEVTRNNNVLRAAGMALACFLLAIGLCPVAAADTIYTYTGNPFNQFSGGATCPPICSISVSLTLAQPLPGDLPFLTLISPLSFSFTDGNTTITQQNQSFMSFLVTTDSQGNIEAWDMEVSSGNPFFGIFLELQTIGFFKDFSEDHTNLAAVVNNPGTWTSTSVPEPSSLLLFGAGLGILGLYRKKRWLVDRLLPE